MTRLRLCGVLAVLLALGLTAPAQNKDLKHTKEEQQLADLINAVRAKDKLPAVKADPLLTKVAREHAANMAKQKKLETELDKKSTTDRLTAAGYKWATSSEHISQNRDLKQLDQVVAGWLKGAFGKEQILSDKYDEIGVGIVPASADPKDGYYISAVFAKKSS